MYIFLLGSNDRFSGLFSKRTSRAAILAQALVIEVLEFFLDWIYIFERHNLNFQIFILKMITFSTSYGLISELSRNEKLLKYRIILSQFTADKFIFFL